MVGIAYAKELGATLAQWTSDDPQLVRIIFAVMLSHRPLSHLADCYWWIGTYLRHCSRCRILLLFGFCFKRSASHVSCPDLGYPSSMAAGVRECLECSNVKLCHGHRLLCGLHWSREVLSMDGRFSNQSVLYCSHGGLLPYAGYYVLLCEGKGIGPSGSRESVSRELKYFTRIMYTDICCSLGLGIILLSISGVPSDTYQDLSRLYATHNSLPGWDGSLSCFTGKRTSQLLSGRLGDWPQLYLRIARSGSLTFTLQPILLATKRIVTGRKVPELAHLLFFATLSSR